MIRFLLLLVLPAFPLQIFSQVFTRMPDPAAAMGMGGSTVALPGLSAGLAQPAHAGWAQKPGVWVAAARPFGLGLWHTGGMQAVSRLGRHSGVGLDLAQSSLEGYVEQRARMVYGRSLGEGLFLGGAVEVVRIGAPVYGHDTGMGAGLGLLMRLLPELWMGAELRNPLGPRLGGEPLPTVMRLGTAWQPSCKLAVLAECAKDVDRPAQVRAGLEYKPVETLALRCGVRTQPARAAFGAGYRVWRGWGTDGAAEWHPLLGFTPAFTFWWRPSPQ